MDSDVDNKDSLSAKQDQTRHTDGAAGAGGHDPLQALQDIEFIKQLMARNQKKLEQGAPFLFIWGTYMMLGFIGMQFIGLIWAITFWPIGSVVGGILSAIIGIRQSRESGVTKGGRGDWMFWLPFLVMILAGYSLMALDIVRKEYLGFFWLTLTGVTYVYLGTLIGRGPIILGIWFIVLSVLTKLFFIEYQNFIFGLMGGGSIVLMGVFLQLRGRKHG
ncbi:hypothetical protein PAECIP111893_03563 [Paenibacillus plantiphilus]|uniref:DUF2157 domain-containing protein n=1 Tax=Paenibacillus plantiphilus TaxID=2905650 RepID=A0ABM9CG18_9BACL|nr:hypothetical protein [Paenibacillus plantiphilus]CAH1212578.1 hypothetical protein PAECIP111893_03563 [Paenibacillus plantiphilus]